MSFPLWAPMGGGPLPHSRFYEATGPVEDYIQLR